MQPHEDDVHALLDLFVDTVAAGASPTFATFKRTWVERHFSHVFEGCPNDMLPEAYIQSLLAAALDCVDGPLPEQLEAGAPAACAGLRPAGGSDGSGGAPAAAPAVDNATLAALLLEDEPDSATAAEAGQASAGAGALALTLGLAGGGAADELAAAQRAGSPPPDLGEMLALPPPPPPALPPGVAALPPGVAAPGGPELPPAPPLAAAGRAGDSSASLPAPASAASSQQAGSAAAGAPQAPSPGTGGPAGTGTREPGAPAAHPGTCRDFARRAAALYAAYALLEAQPRTGLHAEHPRVLLYLPPSRVRALGALAAAAVAAGVRDVAAIVRRLVRERAFVIGAVRRPPCGAPPPVAQAEQLAGNAPSGALVPAQGADGGGREGAAALAHLRDTALQLRELAHVQLLADSYRAAQRRAFGAASPPPVRLMPLPNGSSAVPSGSSRVIWPVPLQYLGLSLLPHCYASGFCRPVLT